VRVRWEGMATSVAAHRERLRDALRHLRRLAGLLKVCELTPPTDPSAATWLMGRAQEAERYAEGIAADLRTGVLDEAAAGASVEGYLGVLHAGLAAHLDIPSPTCCPPRPALRKTAAAQLGPDRGEATVRKQRL
jgi:hypothetical protein